jgi:hypothetical protein
MKIAQLPDGSELQFDPNLSDEAMDAAVQAHMGMGGQAPAEPDPAMMQLAQTFMSLASVMQRGIQAMVQTQQALSQQVGQLGQVMAQNQQELSGRLAQLGHDVALSQQPMAQQIGRLVDQMGSGAESQEAAALAKLSSAVGSAIDRIETALARPKKIVMDSNGRPVGVKTEGAD